MGLRGGRHSHNKSSDIVKKKHVVVQREVELPRPISACSQTESIRSQIPRTDPISSQLSRAEDVDFDKQLCKGSFSSAADDSMWLSSGCISPSSFFKEHELSSPFDLAADEWLVSWLSRIADSYISSSKSKPEELKSFALPKEVTGKILLESMEGAGGITWLSHSQGNHATSSPSDCAERIKSCCENCSDESTSDSNSLMSLSTNLDSSSQVSDMDKTSLMVSSLNLGEDGSQWMSNTELELDSFQSCFPSPSNLSLQQTSEAENMEDFSADDPLFWPFDRKIDWNSEETWKYFSMSPRKDIIKVIAPEETSPISIGSELNNRNTNLPNRCRRKWVPNSGSIASKILELKQGSKAYNNNNNKNSGRVKKANTVPSRLRESTKDSAKIVPLNIGNQILPLKVGEVPTKKSVLTSRNFWEDDFTSNEELSIETVLGLGEFDGHEGIGSEFNECIFLLDEAL
ncbi:hypothetical protein REPUB_Repub20aG0045400 [Reevesia pubescens]